MIPLSPRLYLIGGVVAAFIVVLSFASCEHHRAKVFRADRDKALSQLVDAQSANASNQLVIDSQNRALDKWSKIALSPEDVISLVDNLTKAKKEADERLRLYQIGKESDRALPDCVALLRISLRQRCPSIAAGLLDLATSGENRTGGNSGASPEAATNSAHR